MDEESFPRGGKKQQHTKFTDDGKKKGLFSEVSGDESFQRGGKKAKAKHTKFTEKSDDAEDNLFSEEVEESSSKDSKGKKTKISDQFPDVKERHGKKGKDGSGPDSPHPLTYKELYPGTLLLGCVKTIRNYDMVLSLPNGLSGTVSITNICPAYTDMLQRFSEAQAQGSDLEDESVHTLSELFCVGQLLPCKLLEHNDEGKFRKVVLTVNPQEVNQSVSAGNLKNGMYLSGSIASVEDHGYTVDLGVKGVNAFLKNKDAENFIRQHNNGNNLMVGQCLKCRLSVKSNTKGGKGAKQEVTRVVNVTLGTGESKTEETAGLASVPYIALVPGMKVQAKVEKAEETGLVVSYRSSRGIVHTSHLNAQLNTYTVDSEIICGVMFINPLSKTVAMTTLPHLLNAASGRVSVGEAVSVGQIFEEAKVSPEQSKKGVFLKLKKGLTGYAKMKNLSDSKVENFKEDFKKGSLHRARVLDYQPLENLAIVSTKQSVLDQKYMVLTDVQPGDLVQCSIQKISDKGLIVSVQKGIQAFIPRIHFADITLTQPEKKFKVGEKIKCRVLGVNEERSSLTLTHKKSLIQSKLPIVSDYSQISRGQILEGYINSVKDFGVHVRFYGNVQGLVPRPMLSSQPIEFPEKVFYRGQVVRARVTHVEPDTQRLKLSLVLEDKREFGDKEADVPDDFEIGKCVKCRVVEKSDTGLDVELLPSQKKGFLPRAHLADNVDLATALLDAYRPGDPIASVMYLGKTNIVIVTRKRAFIEAATSGDLVHDFDSVKPELEMPGCVKNVMPYGVFVQFAGRLFGLVPNHLAVDQRVPNVGAVYPAGQSVLARVVEVNTEKRRFLATLKMSDCYHGDSGAQLLDNYFSDMAVALKLLKKHKDALQVLCELHVGQVCKATVTEVTGTGLQGNLDNGVKVTAIKQHVKGNVKVGRTVDCVVLNVDLVNKCVEVSLLHKLLKQLRTIDDTQAVQAQVKPSLSVQSEVVLVKPSLSVQGEVVLVKKDYVLMKLNKPAAGQLAYLPLKRHLNDVVERKKFHIGEVHMTLIERVKNSRVYVCLPGSKKKEPKPEAEALPCGSNLEKAEAQFKSDISSYEGVGKGSVLQGLIVKYTKAGIVVRIGAGVEGILSYERVCRGHRLVSGKSVMPCGTKVSVKVLEKSSDADHHHIELSMLEKDTGVKVNLPLVALKLVDPAAVSDDQETMDTDEGDTASPVKDKKNRKRKTSETSDAHNTSVARTRKDSSGDSGKTDKKKKKRTLSEESDSELVESSVNSQLDSSKKSKRKSTGNEIVESEKKTPAKKRRKSESEDDVRKSGEKRKKKSVEASMDDSDSGVEIKIRKSLDTQSGGQPVLELSEGFSLAADFQLPAITNSGHGDSSDESDTEDTKPVKKSKAELRQQKLDEEKRLYELERRQLEGDVQPETADDFDRLVLQSPDSSLVWLRYMAFHLETSEIDKARTVAERALKTISFREEQEKLNVWVAYLNLENMYGSGDSLGAVLTRATQQNDPVKVNLQMINIYQTSDKIEEAERLFNGLVKKYSGQKDLWHKFGQFYFDQGRPESARKLLQRALKSLPNKFHVETICKFAQFEFKTGESERGKTMFENVLSTYPSRTDLWSVYLDMVIKLKDHTATRALFNRVIGTKLGAKKMKFFFKKFLTFEEQHGTPETVDEIKQRALEYVQTQGYVDE